ncbi:MAG TPA: hypothetical protein VI408_05325 [Gaiellaceae bacterium]
MRLRLVPVAIVAALLAGCGGHSKRAQIADYITRVNDVEKGMAGPLREVSVANRTFAKQQSDPQVRADLATSQKTMRQLRHRLSLITPPAEAEKLHSLLLQLVDQEVALTDEVRKFAVFASTYQGVLQPVQTASNALKAQLSQSTKGRAAAKRLNAEKARDLEAYAATLGSVRAALARLDPPDVWKPTFRQQLSSLSQLQQASLALAGAIGKNDTAAIPTLLERFDAAAVANQSVAAQKRQIAAVKAYDGKIRRIIRLAQRVQLERVALQKRFK